MAFTGFGFRIQLFGSVELAGRLGLPVHVRKHSADLDEDIEAVVRHGASGTPVDALRARSLAEISAAMKKATETTIKNILGYTDEEVVSSDYTTCPNTSIYDSKACIELNANFFKLVSWYDNEWGYSNRLVDLIKHMDKKDGLL